MAIRCEFIDVIIPLRNIDRVFPGGFAEFKAQNSSLFGGRLWHDENLLRDGATSPGDAQMVVSFWERLGLIGIEDKEGERAWKDMCIVELVFGGPTLPCDWLEFDRSRGCVYLKGQAPDPVVGREAFARLTP